MESLDFIVVTMDPVASMLCTFFYGIVPNYANAAEQRKAKRKILNGRYIAVVPRKTRKRRANWKWSRFETADVDIV